LTDAQGAAVTSFTGTWLTLIDLSITVIVSAIADLRLLLRVQRAFGTASSTIASKVKLKALLSDGTGRLDQLE